MNKTVPLPISVLVLATLIAGIAWNTVRAAKNDPTQCPRNLSGQYCLQCHTDAKTLAKMRDKEGKYEPK